MFVPLCRQKNMLMNRIQHCALQRVQSALSIMPLSMRCALQMHRVSCGLILPAWRTKGSAVVILHTASRELSDPQVLDDAAVMKRQAREIELLRKKLCEKGCDSLHRSICVPSVLLEGH